MQITRLPIVIAALVALAACGADTGTAGTPAPPVGTAEPGTTAAPVSTPDESPHEALDAARRRWADLGWSAYRLVYTPTCFCMEEQLTVDVIGGHIVDPGSDTRERSVEQWFDQIDDELDNAHEVRVTYGDNGVPTSLYVDVEERMADEEYGFKLVEVVQIDDALATLLDDEHGCGYGFAIADAGQTASMVVSFDDVDWETGPEVGSYDLADLNGTVRFGADLMANWCDDVIEEGEPEPEVDESWTIVGGTLELTSAGEHLAMATLTGVTAVDADGVEYPLGDVSVTNGSWGFFAG